MRMIRHERYIIVDKDWLFNNKHEIKISYPNLIEIMGIGFFENKEELKKLNYPHCFRMKESWDTHSMPSWEPCDIDEMLNDIAEHEIYLTELEESVKNFYEEVGE